MVVSSSFIQSPLNARTDTHTLRYRKDIEKGLPTSCSRGMSGGGGGGGASPILASCRRIRCLILINDKCGILLLGDAHIIARVILFHNVPRPGIQQNGILVEFRQLRRTHAHQGHSISVR